MRWVKLTLPPPLRPRKPLMTLRLTSSRRAGTLRKLVAVGTPRLRSMLATMAAPAPRIGSPASAVPAGAAAGAGGAVAVGGDGAVAVGVAGAVAVGVAGAGGAGAGGGARG